MCDVIGSLLFVCFDCVEGDVVLYELCVGVGYELVGWYDVCGVYFVLFGYGVVDVVEDFLLVYVVEGDEYDCVCLCGGFVVWVGDVCG